MADDHDSDDWEGRLERKIFRDLYRKGGYPNDGANIEASMFPSLFPFGNGVFDQDRKIQMRFVEHRDHLLRHYDGRFRDSPHWRQWSATIVEAIAAVRAGDKVEVEPYGTNSPEEFRHHMESMNRTKPIKERTVRPLAMRNSLLFLIQNNPAYASDRGRDISEVLEEKLAESRLVDGIVVLECAVCHRYECPEDPDLKLSRCGKCHHKYYCGREHQVQDWKANHKKHCKRILATYGNS